MNNFARYLQMELLRRSPPAPTSSISEKEPTDMNQALNVLLRAAIAAAASDREKFVDRVSGLIEDKVGTSPQTAQKVAGGIDQLVDMLDQQLFFQQLTADRTVDGELEKKIDRLTAAIDKLNANLEKLSDR